MLKKMGPVMITIEEFEAKALAYYERCKDEKEPMTITGLAIGLGFCSRQSIYDYGKRPDYKEVVGRATMMVEHGYELQVARGRGDGGIIFILKNMGWSDKQEIQHSEKVTDTGENGW